MASSLTQQKFIAPFAFSGGGHSAASTKFLQLELGQPSASIYSLYAAAAAAGTPFLPPALLSLNTSSAPGVVVGTSAAPTRAPSAPVKELDHHMHASFNALRAVGGGGGSGVSAAAPSAFTPCRPSAIIVQGQNDAARPNVLRLASSPRIGQQSASSSFNADLGDSHNRSSGRSNSGSNSSSSSSSSANSSGDDERFCAAPLSQRRSPPTLAPTLRQINVIVGGATPGISASTTTTPLLAVHSTTISVAAAADGCGIGASTAAVAKLPSLVYAAPTSSDASDVDGGGGGVALSEGGGSNASGRKRKDLVRDDAYWERRRKNNDAAKRSRDTRRKKEDEVAFRAAILEQENLRLRFEIERLKSEVERHRIVASGGGSADNNNNTVVDKNNNNSEENNNNNKNTMPITTTTAAATQLIVVDESFDKEQQQQLLRQQQHQQQLLLSQQQQQQQIEIFGSGVKLDENQHHQHRIIMKPHITTLRHLQI